MKDNVAPGYSRTFLPPNKKGAGKFPGAKYEKAREMRSSELSTYQNSI